MNTQALTAQRTQFTRLDENPAATSNTASSPTSIRNCYEDVKTSAYPIAKTCGLLTAGFAAGGLVGSGIFGGLMALDVNSPRFNQTADVKMWAKAGAGVTGFLVGGMIGMTTVALHQGITKITKALQGYQSLPQNEQTETVSAFNNPIFNRNQVTTDV